MKNGSSMLYTPIMGTELVQPRRCHGRRRYIFVAVATVLITAFVLVVIFAPFWKKHHVSVVQDPCAVFCEGPILQAVQSRGLFNDSKDFVDMPLRVDPEVALQSFLKEGLNLPNATNDALRAFLTTNFDPIGSDLQPWVPPDYTANPPVLARIANGTLKKWASDINSLWAVLGRQVRHSSCRVVVTRCPRAPSRAPARARVCAQQSVDVALHPERHSLIPLPNPLIVPGGRFRESYYWDSYWIVLGLLACNQHATAKGVRPLPCTCWLRVPV